MIITIYSCDTNHHGSEIVDLKSAYLGAGDGTHPEFEGIWRSIGNGYLLEADKDSIHLYSYTSNFCYQEKNDYLIGQLHSEAQFAIEDDTLRLFLTDYGDQTATLQISRRFVKIGDLPNRCLSYQQMKNLEPQVLFQLFIETAKENYAFSDERNINWDALYNEFLPQISNQTTTEELFELLGEIVTRTKDHHTKIINQDGRRLQYRVTPSATAVIDSFNSQTQATDLDKFFQWYFEHNYQNIGDSLLNGKGQKVANQQIEWGYLNESIGYINIHAFAGFGERISRKQQIDSVAATMDRIIHQLQHTDAIVVDLSFNFGGFDAAVFTVAGYFTDRPFKAYNSQVFADGHFYHESEVMILPAKTINYTKPVYVLMTDISRSAAEGFAMVMGELLGRSPILTNRRLI